MPTRLENLRRLAELKARQEGPVSKPLREDSAFVRAQKLQQVTGPELLLGSSPGRFLQGAASLPLGAAQLVEKAFGGDRLTRTLRQGKEMTQRGREAFKSTGPDIAGLSGALATGGAAVAPLKIPATLGGKLVQGAALGGGFGAATPALSEEFLPEKLGQIGLGAALGGAVPPALAGATAGGRAVGRTARNIIDPFLPGGVDRATTRLLGDVIGDRLPQVKQALQGPVSPNIPAGEAASRAGSAELSALQRQAAKRDPSAFQDIRTARQQDIIGGVRDVGGTPQQLAAAEASRAATASANYKSAFEQSVKADSELVAIFKNPFAKTALTDASRLAKSKGLDIKNGVVDPNDLSEFNHFVKLSLDKSLAKTGDDALSKTEKGEVRRIKGALVDWLKSKNPQYEEARAVFARQSEPINQMQIGQFLENKLVPALSEEAPVRATTFATALRDAPRTIKSATGSRFETLEQALKPQAIRSLERTQGALENQANFARQATAGQPKVQKLIGEIGAERAPNALIRPLMVLNNFLARSGGFRQEAVMQNISEAMKTPQGLLKLLPDITPPQSDQLRTFLQGLPSMQNIARTAPAIAGQEIE